MEKTETSTPTPTVASSTPLFFSRLLSRGLREAANPKAGEEPPYLTVGTDVSAKYKGAFCEAKIKKVIRSVKCKVTFKNNVGSAVVTDDLVRGTLRVGAHVEAKHPEKTQYMEAVINKLHDYSQYTVVFDDGDETTLRRTSLCLKSGRHFAESETLDQLPLTHPEHFGTPVMGSKGRKRRSLNRTLPGGDGSSDEEPSVKKKEAKPKEPEPDMGKVVCVELGDKKKQKDNWVPGLVVSPNAQDSIRVKGKDEYMIKSFKDGKYHVVDKKDTREFTRDIGTKVDGGTLKTAVEKALQYVERDELPPHWDRDVLFGVDNSSNDDNSDQDTESDSSDDEPSEEKDRFVAQLYKFMDDRGTPINKAPTVSNKDLNLYKLFKVVQKLGGYNRATNQMQWKAVYTKMGLPSYNTSSSHQIKQAYKKYLHSFEEFYRKLGCTMSTSTRSSRVRHRSSRNLLMTRDRDREFKAVGRKAAKQSTKKEKDEEKPKAKESDDDGKSEDREKSTTLVVEMDCSDDTESKSCPDESFPNGEPSKSNLADKKSKASKEGRENLVGVDKEDSDADDDKLEKDERSRSKGKTDDGKSDSPSPKRRGRKKLSRKVDLEEGDKGHASDDEPDEPCAEVDTSIGDRVKVKYGRGRQQKIYEAKVLKLDEEEGDRIFFVHYTGWNVRYDEWVKRHRVVENLTQRTIGKRTRLTSGNKGSSKPPAKRGRPQGSTSAAKSQVSNSGGRKTGGPSRPRSTRSDRSSLAESPFVNGLEPKKRGRKISGPQAATSDASDSDSGESDAGSLGRRSSKRLSKHDTSTEDLDTSIEEEREKDEGPGYDEDELGPGRAYESLEDADVDDRRGRTKPSKKSSPIKTRVDGSDDEGVHGHSDDDIRKVTDTKPARRSRGRPSKNQPTEVKEELKGGTGKDNRRVKTKKTTEDEVGDDDDLDDMNGKTVSDILERIGLDKDDDDDDDDLALPMKPPCSLDDWKENRLFATSDHQYSDPTKDLDDLKMPSTGPDSPKESEHIEVVIKQAADENDAMLDRVVAVIANQSGSSDTIAISFPSEMGVIIAKENDGDLDGMAEVEAPKLAAETEIDEPMPNLEKEMPPNLLLDAIPTLEMETAMFESAEEAAPVENDDEKALSIAESPTKEEIYVVIGELTAPAIIHQVPVMSPVCERNETSQDGIEVVGKTVDVNDQEGTSVDVNELVCKDSELIGDTSDILKKEEEEMTKAAEMQSTYDRTVDVGYQPPLPIVESATNDGVECPESIPETKIEDIELHPSDSTDRDMDGSTPEALAPDTTLNDQAATSDTLVDTQERDSREVFEPAKIALAAIPEVTGVLPDTEKSSMTLVTESGQSSSWNEDIVIADQVRKTDTEARFPNECESTIEEEPCISTATIEALTAPPSSDPPVESSHCKGSKKDRRRQKGKRLEKRRSMDVADDSSDETSVEDEPRTKKKKSRDERTDARARDSQGKGESRPKKSREKRSKSSKRGDSDRDDSKTLKKKGSSWKARRKECKKKKESSEKEARSHKVGDERMDSDDVSSQSSDGSLQRKSKKSKKHSKAGDKGRDSPTDLQSERRKYLSSKRSKASSESGSPSEGHTSDDGHWESSAKKIRKEERSKRDKKRKDRSKKKSNSGDDSDSSIGRTVLSPEITVVNVEQQKASEVGDAQASLFLMCEERVPASPLAVEDVAPTFPSEERLPCASKDATSSLLIPEISSAAPLNPVPMSCTSVPVLSFELTVTPKVKTEPQPPATTSTALLDNTPPTTPESAELDNSPPPCRERGITLVSPSHDASDSTTSGSKSNQGCCQDDYAPSTGTSFERLLQSHKYLQTDTVETGQVTTVLPKRSKPESDDQTSKKKNKKSHKKQGSLESKPSSVPVIAAAPVGTRQRQNPSKTLKGSDNEERPALPLDHTATLGQSSTSPSGTHPGNLGVSVDPRGIGTPPRPSRFNFYVELDDYSDGAERIAILQEKLTELRKTYMALKAEVACIDRRRKKLKRKEKEVSPAASGASSAAVECS